MQTEMERKTVEKVQSKNGDAQPVQYTTSINELGILEHPCSGDYLPI